MNVQLTSLHRTYKSKSATTVYVIRFFLGIFESVSNNTPSNHRVTVLIEPNSRRHGPAWSPSSSTGTPRKRSPRGSPSSASAASSATCSSESCRQPCTRTSTALPDLKGGNGSLLYRECLLLRPTLHLLSSTTDLFPSGCITMFWGFIGLFAIPDSPAITRALWLTPAERELARTRMADHGTETAKIIDRKTLALKLRKTATNPVCWLFLLGKSRAKKKAPLGAAPRKRKRHLTFPHLQPTSPTPGASAPTPTSSSTSKASPAPTAPPPSSAPTKSTSSRSAATPSPSSAPSA